MAENNQCALDEVSVFNDNFIFSKQQIIAGLKS